jgi:hypothetical protein
MKISVGIASYGLQSPTWWMSLAILLVRMQKSGIQVALVNASSMATDYNRNEIVRLFLESDADYLFWLDTDNIITYDGLCRLIENRKPLVTGLYHLKKPPYTPVAYIRNEDGYGYVPIRNYRLGEIIPIDMAGMGACLTHRSVYERIAETHLVLERTNGALFTVPKASVRGTFEAKGTPWVENGIYHEPVRPYTGNRPFPFFYLEYGRTEDVIFYEMAKAAGIQPYVDTGVQVTHLGEKEYGRKDFLTSLRTEKISRERMAEWQEIIRMFSEKDGHGRND